MTTEWEVHALGEERQPGTYYDHQIAVVVAKSEATRTGKVHCVQRFSGPPHRDTTMLLHGARYVITTTANDHAVAYPASQWNYPAGRPALGAEQCDCLETAVDYYRLTRVILYSEGKPVLYPRDISVLDALLDIVEGRPRKPRHSAPVSPT